MEEPLTFPWFEFSEIAERFCNMLTTPDGYCRTSTGLDGEIVLRKKFLEHREAITTADGKQLAKFLTVLVRQDRFCEGTLVQAYEDKTLLAIVERADNLLRTPAPGGRPR